MSQQPQEQPQKSHKQDILRWHLHVNQLIFASYGAHTTNYLHLWGFFCIRDAGCRGNKITASALPLDKYRYNSNDLTAKKNKVCSFISSECVYLYVMPVGIHLTHLVLVFGLGIWILSSRADSISRSFASLTHERYFQHSKIKFVSLRSRVISSIYTCFVLDAELALYSLIGTWRNIINKVFWLFNYCMWKKVI